MKTLFSIALGLFMYKSVTIHAAVDKAKNVVIIMADDLGFHDVSYRGSNEFPTYNIDALAYSGVILDRFYTAQMCTPSRSSLLTGKYPHHVGMQNFVIASDDPFGLGMEQKLMPEYFKEAGYSTHLVGKWHQGFYQKQYWPSNRGFDTFFGYLGPYIGYYDYSLQMFNRNYSRGYDLRRDFEIDRSYNQLYTTDMLSKEAINVIENYGKENPFFLIVSHLAPHAGNEDIPLEAKAEDFAKFAYIENEKRRKLAGMVHSLDESVGDIVEALVKNDLMKDTIVMFFSDNGGPSAFLHATTASNYPLRSQKESAFEGAIRTGAVVYAPFLPSGVIRKELFYIADLLPTLSTLASANFVIDRKIDGFDLSSVITKGSSSLRSEIITIDDVFGYSSFIMNGFKLVNGSSSAGQADGWLGSNNNSEINSSQYIDGVLYSKVAQSLKNLMNLESSNIQQIRSDVKVQCAGVKNECDLLKAPCLFDIINDPCEENNLAFIQFSTLEFLTLEFEERLKTLVRARRRTRDSACDPANFNNTWDAWQEDSKDKDSSAQKVQVVSKTIMVSVPILFTLSFLVVKYS